MTDEINGDPIENEDAQALEVEQEDSQSSESSTDSEDKHEPKSNGVQERINTITAQKYAEKQAREAAEKRAAELEAKLNAQESLKVSNTVMPPSPDLQYEDAERYAQEMAAYTSQVAQNAFKEQQRLQQEEASKAAQEAQLAETRQSFEVSAKESNITIEDAYNAVETLAERGLQGTALENAIMQHPKKAALMKHLAQNPHDYDELLKTNHPIKAWEGLKAIESKALSKKVSTSPEPIPDVKSTKGIAESDDYGGMFTNAQFD